MPMTPMPVNASLTSSSLNGLMTASIFFIAVPPCPGEQRPCRTEREKSRHEIARFRLAAPFAPRQNAYESGNLDRVPAFWSGGSG